MKSLSHLVPIVHLAVVMLASSVHAMPATPGAAIASLHGTRGAFTSATPGLLASASSRAFNDSSQPLGGDNEYDPATLEEALQLIEENAHMDWSEALVCSDSQQERFKGLETSSTDAVLSVKDGKDTVLEVRKPNWKKIAKIIGLCASCASCLTNNRYGANCPKLCHDCKHCCPQTG